jgi:hypothetical protein
VDLRDETEPDRLETLASVFKEQLLACLEECARGRQGLFSDVELIGDDGGAPWPEAARLRELALALQGVFAQQEEQNALSEEFLDLCSSAKKAGSSFPRRLARRWGSRWATRYFFGWKTTNCGFRLCGAAFDGRNGVFGTSLRLEPWFPMN